MKGFRARLGNSRLSWKPQGFTVTVWLDKKIRAQFVGAFKNERPQYRP